MKPSIKKHDNFVFAKQTNSLRYYIQILYISNVESTKILEKKSEMRFHIKMTNIMIIV